MAQWSPAVKINRCCNDKILLSHNYYEPISNAVGKLREAVNTKTKILGKIKKLESVPDLAKRTSGKITVVYLNDDDMKSTVTVNLKKEDYDKAIEAHSRGNYIEIIGDISNHGKRSKSISCDSFNIID